MLTAIRAARRIGSDDGFTLAEMIVGMALASMVGAMMLTWFIGASDSTTASTDSSIATGGARNILQSWAKYLQLAGSPTTPGSGTGRVVSVSPTSIDFYAHLDGDACSSDASCAPVPTTEIELSLVDGDLVEQIGDNASSVALPGKIVSAGACLFTPTANGSALPCSGLSAPQLDSVTGVDIAFTLTPKSGHPRSYVTSATFTTYNSAGADNAQS